MLALSKNQTLRFFYICCIGVVGLNFIALAKLLYLAKKDMIAPIDIFHVVAAGFALLSMTVLFFFVRKNIVRTKTEIIIAFVAAIVLVAGLGYLSNRITSSACETKIAKWISSRVLQNQEFYVISEGTGYSSSFSFVKARVKQYQYQSKRDDHGRFRGFPWAGVNKAEALFPYVMRVRWGYVKAPLIGEGGETIFLCLFGFTVKLQHYQVWVT